MILAVCLYKAAPAFTSLNDLLNAASSFQIRSRHIQGAGYLPADPAGLRRMLRRGEKALAAKAELAGKLAMLLIALPLFEKVAELAVSLMNGQAVSG